MNQLRKNKIKIFFIHNSEKIMRSDAGTIGKIKTNKDTSTVLKIKFKTHIL